MLLVQCRLLNILQKLLEKNLQKLLEKQKSDKYISSKNTSEFFCESRFLQPKRLPLYFFFFYRNWAIHTKKYQEGQPPDISTWKTRFRCALYKLPDINELNNMNVIEGDNPYRVYQFVKKGKS